jgi:hypothetical protein
MNLQNKQNGKKVSAILAHIKFQEVVNEFGFQNVVELAEQYAEGIWDEVVCKYGERSETARAWYKAYRTVERAQIAVNKLELDKLELG